MHVPRAEQFVQTSTRLGFQPVDQRRDGLQVTVPGWRRFDVEGRADLAEEVGRIAGFDLVPTTMPDGALPGAAARRRPWLRRRVSAPANSWPPPACRK